MHVHLPKPLHGWRELAGEVGVIVLGVLIALALEQVVQNWEWRHKVHAAAQAMRAELLWDDAPEVYQRAAMHPCLVQRLDAIRAAVEADRSRAEVMQAIDGYWVQFLSFDSLAHDAANSSDVATHMPSREFKLFTDAYSMMPLMDRTTSAEAADYAWLRAVRRTGGPLSEAEASQVLNAVEALRNHDRVMWASARWLIPSLRALGPFDAERMRRFMSNARAHYGACVRDLSPAFPKDAPDE